MPKNCHVSLCGASFCGRYQPSDLVKLDVLLNGSPVDALSVIVHRTKAQRTGKDLVERLRKTIERCGGYEGLVVAWGDHNGVKCTELFQCFWYGGIQIWVGVHKTRKTLEMWNLNEGRVCITICWDGEGVRLLKVT